MKRLSGETGFGLTELLVTISLGMAVLGISVVAFASFAHQRNRAVSESRAQDDARVVIDRVAGQLRSAKPSSSGSQAIERSTSYDLVFLAPAQSANLTNNPAGLAHVRYCLDAGFPSDEALWLQTAAYSSTSQPSPPSTSSCPSPAWPNQRLVARHIVNAFSSPASPLFIPTSDASGNITDIAIDAFVDGDPTTDPPSTELRSSVTLRNLNRPPVASLNCQAATNGHALCDASGSADPEGRNLSYAWSMDGSPLAETTYRLDQAGLASKSIHSFTVTVTDPEGLSSNTSQSVTMP